MSSRQLQTKVLQYGALSALACCTVLALGSRLEAADSGYRFLWVRVMLGPCCGDAGVDLKVGDDGEALVAGYRGGLDLDADGAAEVRSFGSIDPLIFKSSDAPNEGFVQAPGGPQYDEAKSVAPDRQGGAYAVGYFGESMRIAGGTIRSNGPRDGFLARYDRNGATQWAKPIGAAGQDQLDAVGSDSAGNAYVAGTVSGSVDLDQDGSIDAKAGPASLLLASFDRSGGLRWARSTSGTTSLMGRSIAVGPQGEVYVGGLYRNGALDLDGDGKPEGKPAAEQRPNGYFARFDADGRMIWARSVESPGVQAVASIAVAGNGDLLVLSGGIGPADLDGDGTYEVNLPETERSAFLARFTPDGAVVWVKTLAPAPIHVSASADHIALVGFYEGSLDLDLDGAIDGPAGPDARNQGMVAILDNEGALLHTFIIDGPESDHANASGFTPDGKHLFVTGYLRLTADFDGDGVAESGVRCDARGDVFLAKYAIGE